ncbi:uncharacterized protein LOC123694764 [Colias croceus]|uniref:uncharacterized protein LOC123694764 n=1 Tax=Colias crocea TaxID=72248 RepID=UPI001E27E0A4|nr:uncharacterized protein LOC123694764 [Colias croceus]
MLHFLQLQPSQFRTTTAVFIMDFVGKHPRLIHKNFSYKRQRVNKNGVTVWYCSKRKFGCKAYANTWGEKLLAASPHDHDPPIQWDMDKLQCNMLEQDKPEDTFD